MAKIDTGIHPTGTNTAQGSHTPVESNTFPGYPDAAVPAIHGTADYNFGAAGCEDNILGDVSGGGAVGEGSAASYALGNKRPD